MTEQSRAVVVTGASSGIGHATALRLARNGWRVFAAVRRDAEAEALKAEAVGTLTTIRLDVADPDLITAASRELKARLTGRGLDALYNNAGIGITGPVEQLSSLVSDPSR